MAIEAKSAEQGRTIIKFIDAGYFLFIAAWVAWRVPVRFPRFYIIGLSMGAIGFALCMAARQQLGKSFTVSAKGEGARNDWPVFQDSQSHLFFRRSCVRGRFSCLGKHVCPGHRNCSLFHHASIARAERIGSFRAGVWR